MINLKYIVCIILCTVLLSSCREKTAEFSDEYIPGQDMQYFSTSEWYKTAYLQEYEGGCYVHHDGFIYVYDRKSGSIAPLCSKPNCLHDKETDGIKRRECNAYLDNKASGGSVSVMLYKEYLYVFYDSSDATIETHSPDTLVRMNCDGSSKDILYKVNGAELAMIHRRFLYYYSQSYQADEETGIKGVACILRLDIESGNAKPEVIFTAPEEVNGYGFLRGYGSHIYFTLNYRNRESYPCLYVYDIKSKEVMEMKESMSGRPAWFQKKLYMRPFEYQEDYHYETPLYRMAWDGSQKETIIEKLSQGYEAYSDGKYLYMDNQSLHELYGEKRHVLVYDEDMKLFDEYTYPSDCEERFAPPIGGERYQYLKYADEETGEWGLAIWDKSSIGSLCGNAYTQEKVSYEGSGEPGKQGDDSSSSGSRTEEAREYMAELDEWSEETVSRTSVKSPDKIDEHTAEGRLFFNEKSVKAVTSHETANNKATEVWGYYLTGNSVFRHGYTVTVTNEHPAEAELTLPEEAEKYLGAQGRHYAEKDGFNWQDFTYSGQTKKAKP